MRIPLTPLVMLVALVSIPVLASSSALSDETPGTADETPIVAILDTGIEPDHSEFREGQLVAFKDFVNGEDEPYDDRGHGTAVASRVAGATYGAFPEARLAMAKVLTSTGTLQDPELIGEAVRWAVDDVEADVISVSIGTTAFKLGEESDANSAIRYAHRSGVTVVWAAGNWRTFLEGPPNNPFGDNPTTLLSGGGVSSPYALLAGAAHEDGTPWEQSAYIPDVLAWGASVPVATRDNGTATLSGSSFAAPFVAGVAARLIHEDPTIPPQKVQRIIKTTAQDDPTTPYHLEGYGFVDETSLQHALQVARGEADMPLRPLDDAQYLAFTGARSVPAVLPHVQLIPVGL